MIDRLIELDRKTKKRIAVIGDALIDEWVHGSLHSCQDHCPKFVETHRLTTPGGADGAARQLKNWNCEVYLHSQSKNKSVKRRFIDENNRIIFRHDLDQAPQFTASDIVESICVGMHAVLISDYEKGFLDPPTIRKIIDLCNERKIPVVADAKREPSVYWGSIIKANRTYADKYVSVSTKKATATVITDGPRVPGVCHKSDKPIPISFSTRPVQCVNHVGAGDCFAAHLTFALAHGLSLEDAAIIAHSAGRVYVQHLHGRPPYPFEIKKDSDPVGGKVLDGNSAAALRKSNVGRIVFANGVFRIPHAGHAWLLNWAKQQGNVLVVGLNDDESANALRPGEFCLPLQERCEILAGLSCVDWVIPFSEADPCATIRQLKPDLLIKGSDYAHEAVPGSDLVEVRFAPESPYAGHCADLVKAVRG